MHLYYSVMLVVVICWLCSRCEAVQSWHDALTAHDAVHTDLHPAVYWHVNVAAVLVILANVK